jgi:hypothetical protein
MTPIVLAPVDLDLGAVRQGLERERLPEEAGEAGMGSQRPRHRGLEDLGRVHLEDGRRPIVEREDAPRGVHGDQAALHGAHEIGRKIGGRLLARRRLHTRLGIGKTKLYICVFDNLYDSFRYFLQV